MHVHVFVHVCVCVCVCKEMSALESIESKLTAKTLYIYIVLD